MPTSLVNPNPLVLLVKNWQYISMCPDGAEGTTYAILTTMSNVSMAAAQDLGTMFTRIWDVSNETLWWVFYLSFFC